MPSRPAPQKLNCGSSSVHAPIGSFAVRPATTHLYLLTTQWSKRHSHTSASGRTILFHNCDISHFFTMKSHFVANLHCSSTITHYRLSLLHLQCLEIPSQVLKLCTLHPSSTLILFLHRIPNILRSFFAKNSF